MMKTVIQETHYFASYKTDKINVLALLLVTQCVPVVVYRRFGTAHKFGLGSSSALLPPGDTSTSVADARGLLYHPRIYNHSYSGRQVPLASTTRGSAPSSHRRNYGRK
jgi:hypothetical protein